MFVHFQVSRRVSGRAGFPRSRFVVEEYHPALIEFSGVIGDQDGETRVNVQISQLRLSAMAIRRPQ